MIKYDIWDIRYCLKILYADGESAWIKLKSRNKYYFKELQQADCVIIIHCRNSTGWFKRKSLVIYE